MLRGNSVHIKKQSSPVMQFLERVFLEQKLRNGMGVLIFVLLALLLGYLMTHQLLLGLGLTGMLVGAAVLIACMASTETGLYINTIYSFFGFHISRWFFNDALPVGVLSDILLLATLLSLVISKKRIKPQANEFAKSTLGILFFIFAGFTAIELFNPYANSFVGWYQAFRKIIGVLSILFISYIVFENEAKIKAFLKLLFVLATVTGLYGCIQEWHGFFGFEQAWVTADEHRFGLMFINGNMRKMGTMSDPAEYSIVMAACATFFLIMGIFQKRALVKLLLFAGCIFMLLGMGYSGTRTANAMMVAGLAVYILLTIDKPNTQRFAIVGVIIFCVLMYAPIYNPTIARFRSTFSASQDASFNVREMNRKRIQPYIYEHPIGGGFGTSGGAGATYNAGHPLAGFQTDSGYLRKAVESGWIGLLLVCILYYSTLRTGAKGYFSTPSLSRKHLYAASIATLFSFYVAEFSQSAIGQITDIFVYYPVVAIVMKLSKLPLNPQPTTVP